MQVSPAKGAATIDAEELRGLSMPAEIRVADAQGAHARKRIGMVGPERGLSHSRDFLEESVRLGMAVDV